MLQKSRKTTVLILAILVIYSIIANYSLVSYGLIYYSIVNPLFWFMCIVLLNILFAKSPTNTRLKKEITEYSLIASLVYVGIYILSDFFLDVGKNPYSLGIKGILINCIVYIFPIVVKEYVRYRLINNVYEKDKKFIAILSCIIFILIDIGIFDTSNTINLIKIFFADILPIIAVNIVCTYMAINKTWKPAVYYRTITIAYWLIMPILPKVPWIIVTVVDTVIPIMLVVNIRYIKKKKEISKNNKEEETANPRTLIPAVALVILFLWFGMGIFPIKPVAIASGSMEKTISVGDIVILKKCKPVDIEVGDIIQYQKDNFTVVHRVISKYEEQGKKLFITKGDNNRMPDKEPVSETQVLAKEIFSIKYIGYPAVFFSRINLKEKPDTGSIEKGK